MSELPTLSEIMKDSGRSDGNKIEKLQEMNVGGMICGIVMYKTRKIKLIYQQYFYLTAKRTKLNLFDHLSITYLVDCLRLTLASPLRESRCSVHNECLCSAS